MEVQETHKARCVMTTKLYNLGILRTQAPPKPHENYGHGAKFPSSLSFSQTLKRDHSNVTEQRHWDLSTNCNFPNIWAISDLRDYQNDQPCMHFFVVSGVTWFLESWEFIQSLACARQKLPEHQHQPRACAFHLSTANPVTVSCRMSILYCLPFRAK